MQEQSSDLRPNLGGPFRGSFWGGGGGELPRVKLVRIMLKTSNLAHKYTHTCKFRKFTFKCPDPQKSAFFGKNNTFTQSNIVKGELC